MLGFDKMVNAFIDWGWRARLAASIGLLIWIGCSYSLMERIPLLPCIVLVGLIVTPFLFREKHVEFDEQSAEEIEVHTWQSTRADLMKFLHLLQSQSISGIDQERLEIVEVQLGKFHAEFNRAKSFNYFILCSDFESALTLNIRRAEGELLNCETSCQPQLKQLICGLLQSININ